MSRAGKMRMRKTDDRRIVILVAGAVFIRVGVVFSVNIVRLLIGIGRKLDRAERYGRAGLRMPHLLRSDQRIDIADVVFRFL